MDVSLYCSIVAQFNSTLLSFIYNEDDDYTIKFEHCTGVMHLKQCLIYTPMQMVTNIELVC